MFFIEPKGMPTRLKNNEKINHYLKEMFRLSRDSNYREVTLLYRKRDSAWASNICLFANFCGSMTKVQINDCGVRPSFYVNPGILAKT